MQPTGSGGGTPAGGTDGFLQDPPHLGNQVADDAFLLSLLRRLVPPDVLRSALPDLERFGWDVATSVKELGQQAEREPPTLGRQDAWGARVDTVVTSPAWRELKAVAAREGLVAAAYQRRHAHHSRVLQLAKLYVFGASSGLFNCPLAMTDGAARLCELLLQQQQDEQQRQAGSLSDAQGRLAAALHEAFAHLTSQDPDRFWTSGQWMTEKAGGSDVARATETVAEPEEPSQRGVGCWFRLTGYKWFTSAADGEMAMVLARETTQPGDQQSSSGGSGGSGARGGLTLFYMPVTRDAAGRPQVVRLKDKLGTRQLPTAELRLGGMRGLKISEAGRGIAAIAAMVNVTRLHNAAAATSYMRRITALAQDYARRRRVFGALLIGHPLAQRTLAWLHLHTAGSLALTLEVACLLGLQECGAGSPEDARLLRLLTPLAKLFTAKEAVAVVSEGIEFFGGQGYIEGTHLPVILRDAQVLPIWEGTTVVLSLDVLRVLSSSPGSAAAFVHSCSAQLAGARAAAVRMKPIAAGSDTAVATTAWCMQGSGPGSRMIGPGAGSDTGVAAGRDSARVASDLPLGSLLEQTCEALQRELPAVARRLRAAAAAAAGSAAVQVGARDLAFAMARLYAGVLLAAHAAWSGDAEHVLLAAEWARECVPAGAGLLCCAAQGGARRGGEGGARSGPGGGAAQAAAEGGEEAHALLRTAWVLSGAGSRLSQPRARY